MPKMSLNSQDAKYAIMGDLEGFELIETEIVEEWRWGILESTVIKDSEGNFWESTYRVQTGDNYYHEYEDHDMVEFTQVEPVEVVKVVYKPVKD